MRIALAGYKVDHILEIRLTKTIIVFPLLRHLENCRKVFIFLDKRNCYSKLLISIYLYFFQLISNCFIFPTIFSYLKILEIIENALYRKNKIPMKYTNLTYLMNENSSREKKSAKMNSLWIKDIVHSLVYCNVIYTQP